MTQGRSRRLWLVLTVALVACKADDPVGTPDGPPRPDAEVHDAEPDAVPVDADPGCQPLASDYQPRDDGSASDTWAACISDDNLYHPFNASISTVARVAAFEQIATLLFTGNAQSSQDFIDARIQYNLSNGLASRVQRREDEHYPPVLDGNGAAVACQSLTSQQQQANPDRCVGPARISPLLEAAFDVGQNAASTPLERRIAAARIEAGLLWFFYVSAYKEPVTCTTTPADCDSGYAYYTGGDPRETGKGLARYTRALDVEAHDRIWDGILAFRCWRDLDNPTGVAVNLAMRDQAIDQFDVALLRGVSLIVRDKTVDVANGSGEARTALWELVRVLGPVLDREATARDAATATLLRTELARTDVDAVNTTQIFAALATIFPCP